MAEKFLLLGDEALALGALHAGLSGVFAYPGTPSTEITEYIQAHPLTQERGFADEYVKAAGYWLLGVADAHEPH